MEIHSTTRVPQAMSLIIRHSRPSVQPVISDLVCGKGLPTGAPQAHEQEYRYQESVCHVRQ